MPIHHLIPKMGMGMKCCIGVGGNKNGNGLAGMCENASNKSHFLAVYNEKVTVQSVHHDGRLTGLRAVKSAAENVTRGDGPS